MNMETARMMTDIPDRLKAQGGRTPAEIVDGCLDLMGPLEMNPHSRQGLIGFIEVGGDFRWDTDEHVQASTARVSELLQLIVATREYQFARTLLYREELEKRVRLSIFLQSAAKEDHIDQDIDKERFLSHFPTQRGEAKPGEKYYSLSEYDAILAFDPDWSALTLDQLKLVREWVPQQDFAAYHEAILRFYNQYGRRDNIY